MNISPRGLVAVVSIGLGILVLGGCRSLPDPGDGVPPPTSARQPGRTSPGQTEAKRALPFPDSSEWINTDRALTMESLRGRFVLLDFWTYGCINCIHMIPNLNSLADTFSEELVVIGVHSGKFNSERVAGNLAQAVERLGIRYPVLNDPELELWKTYGVPAWPTIVLINPVGEIVGAHAGEWPLSTLENLIRGLIEESEQSQDIATDFGNVELGVAEPDRSTLLRYPEGLLLDEAADRLYVADTGNHRVISVDPESGNLISVIGSGAPGFLDGSAAAARFSAPRGMAMLDGALYIADSGNHAIRRFDPETETVMTVVQGDVEEFGQLRSPWDLVTDGDTIYVATAGEHQIWTVDPDTGDAREYAGSGSEGLVDGPVARAQMAQPQGIALFQDSLYVADAESSAIRRIANLYGEPHMETIVGQGLFQFGLQDGPAPLALFNHPSDVVVLPISGWARESEDPGGDNSDSSTDGPVPQAALTLYVSDSYNNVIRRIQTGQVSQVNLGETVLDEPTGLVTDGTVLWVADTNNHRVVRIDPDRSVTEPLSIGSSESQVVRRQVPAGAGEDGWHMAFTIRLPEGYKLNQDSPNSIVFESQDGSTLTHQITPTEQPVEQVRIPLQRLVNSGVLNLPESSGQTVTTSADLWLYYCEIEDATVCRFDGTAYQILLETSDAGPSSDDRTPVGNSILIDHTIPKPGRQDSVF